MEFSHSSAECLPVETVGEGLPGKLNHGVGWCFKALLVEVCRLASNCEYVGDFNRELVRKSLVSNLQAHRDLHSCLNPNKTMEDDVSGIQARLRLIIQGGV